MSPLEAYARHRLGKLSGEQMVALANEWLDNGQYSDGLNELFSLENNSIADASPYFEKAMAELGIPEPSRREAAEIVIWQILSRVIGGNMDPVEGVEFLYWHVHHELQEEIPDVAYLGDNLGLESLFAWLREIWDCRDGSMLLYYADLPRSVAERKQIENLVAEAKRRLQAQPNHSLKADGSDEPRP